MYLLMSRSSVSFFMSTRALEPLQHYLTYAIARKVLPRSPDVGRVHHHTRDTIWHRARRYILSWRSHRVPRRMRNLICHIVITLWVWIIYAPTDGVHTSRDAVRRTFLCRRARARETTSDPSLTPLRVRECISSVDAAWKGGEGWRGDRQ